MPSDVLRSFPSALLNFSRSAVTASSSIGSSEGFSAAIFAISFWYVPIALSRFSHEKTRFLR